MYSRDAVSVDLAIFIPKLCVGALAAAVDGPGGGTDQVQAAVLHGEHRCIRG